MRSLEADFYVVLGQRIRAGRGRMPQARLAELVGVGRTSIVLIERGQQQVRAYTLSRIAQALGRPVGELLNGLGGEAVLPSRLELDSPVSDAARQWLQTMVVGASSQEAEEGHAVNEPADQGRGRSTA